MSRSIWTPFYLPTYLEICAEISNKFNTLSLFQHIRNQKLLTTRDAKSFHISWGKKFVVDDRIYRSIWNILKQFPPVESPREIKLTRNQLDFSWKAIKYLFLSGRKFDQISRGGRFHTGNFHGLGLIFILADPYSLRNRPVSYTHLTLPTICSV